MPRHKKPFAGTETFSLSTLFHGGVPKNILAFTQNSTEIVDKSQRHHVLSGWNQRKCMFLLFDSRLMPPIKPFPYSKNFCLEILSFTSICQHFNGKNYIIVMHLFFTTTICKFYSHSNYNCENNQTEFGNVSHCFRSIIFNHKS